MSRFLSDNMRSLRAYVPGEQPKVKNLIKLNTNESPFPPAPGVKAAVEKAAETLRLYNDLSASRLVKLLADTCGVAEGQVFVGNGSDEVLAFAFQAFGGGGVVFPDITYGCYPIWCSLYHLDAKTVPLDGDFRIRPEDYRGNDRCVVIANPNAPTGIALTLDEIAAIARANPDQVVIVDEAYVDFGADSAVKLLGAFENILVVRTFSKSRQMAGARLGFALGREALIRDLNLIRYSFHPYNVNSMTQAAGAAALEDPAYFEKCRRAVMETREWTAGQLKALGFRVLDSKANFLYAAAPDKTGAEYQKKLREKNILIRYFDLPRTKDFVRITVGSRSDMETLIRETKELLK